MLQRFKSVETSHSEKNWQVAKHLEITPELRVTSVTQAERERAMKREREKLKVRGLLAATKGASH